LKKHETIINRLSPPSHCRVWGGGLVGVLPLPENAGFIPAFIYEAEGFV
jgi:hypothetical protein